MNVLQYKIKAIREKIMTQESFSERAVASRRIISRLESGEEVVTTTEILLKIEETLGRTLDKLVGERSSKEQRGT